MNSTRLHRRLMIARQKAVDLGLIRILRSCSKGGRKGAGSIVLSCLTVLERRMEFGDTSVDKVGLSFPGELVNNP